MLFYDEITSSFHFFQSLSVLWLFCSYKDMISVFFELLPTWDKRTEETDRHQPWSWCSCAGYSQSAWASRVKETCDGSAASVTLSVLQTGRVYLVHVESLLLLEIFQQYLPVLQNVERRKQAETELKESHTNPYMKRWAMQYQQGRNLKGTFVPWEDKIPNFKMLQLWLGWSSACLACWGSGFTSQHRINQLWWHTSANPSIE